MMKRFIIEFSVVIAIIVIAIGGFIFVNKANAGSFVDENGVHVLGIVCIDESGVKADNYHILDGKCYPNTPSTIPSQEPSIVPSEVPSISPIVEPSVIPSEQPVSSETNSGKGNVPSNPSTNTTQAPVCSDGITVNVVANPHVIRNGKDATVNFFITEGDSANIYYSVVGQPHWGNAVANVKPNSDNFVSYTIHDLDASQGYDFGIEQKTGCGGGKVTSVIVDSNIPHLFRFSYYE